jgi:hypothetical protein
MIEILLAALVAAAPAEPPEREFSVFREVVLLSGVTLSVAGTVLAGVAVWKDEERAGIAASGLIGAGSIFSLGTMFGSHRWEPPPDWVFIVGPVIGLVATGVAAIAASDFLR